jgi:hypothetical protein
MKVLKLRFWRWTGIKCAALCRWAASLSDRINDYERRESLIKLAYEFESDTKKWDSLIEWYSNPEL